MRKDNSFKGMKSILFAVCLLGSTLATASKNHNGDHMHMGKMQNHSNKEGKTNEELEKLRIYNKAKNHAKKETQLNSVRVSKGMKNGND